MADRAQSIIQLQAEVSGAEKLAQVAKMFEGIDASSTKQKELQIVLRSMGFKEIQQDSEKAAKAIKQMGDAVKNTGQEEQALRRQAAEVENLVVLWKQIVALRKEAVDIARSVPQGGSIPLGPSARNLSMNIAGRNAASFNDPRAAAAFRQAGVQNPSAGAAYIAALGNKERLSEADARALAQFYSGYEEAIRSRALQAQGQVATSLLGNETGFARFSMGGSMFPAFRSLINRFRRPSVTTGAVNTNALNMLMGKQILSHFPKQTPEQNIFFSPADEMSVSKAISNVAFQASFGIPKQQILGRLIANNNFAAKNFPGQQNDILNVVANAATATPVTPINTSGGGGRGFLGALTSLTRYTSAAAIIYGISASIRDAVSAGIEFESVMKRVQGVLPTQSTFQKALLDKSVVDASKRYGIDLLEAAKSVQIFAQQGLSTNQIIKELNATMAASQGLGISTDEAKETLITVRNITAVETEFLSDREKKVQEFVQHQVESMEFLDRIAKISAQSAVSPEVLMNSVRQSAAVASQFRGGVSGLVDPLDLVMGMTSTLAPRTATTGQSAGTAINFMLARLTQPHIVNELGKFGANLAVQGSGGRELRPLQEIMQELSDTYKKLGPGSTEAKDFLGLVGGTRQIRNIAIILTEYNKSLETARLGALAHGDAEARVGLQLDTTKVKLEQLHTEIRSLGLYLIDGPLGKGFRALIDSINEGIEETVTGTMSAGDKIKTAGWLAIFRGNFDAAGRLFKFAYDMPKSSLDKSNFRSSDIPRLDKFTSDATMMGTTPEDLIAATGNFAEQISRGLSSRRNIGGEIISTGLSGSSSTEALVKHFGGDRSVIVKQMLEQFRVTPGGKAFLTWLDSITASMDRTQKAATQVKTVMALLGDVAYISHAANLPHNKAIDTLEQITAKMGLGERAKQIDLKAGGIFEHVKNPLADWLIDFYASEKALDANTEAAKRLGQAFDNIEERYQNVVKFGTQLFSLKDNTAIDSLRMLMKLRENLKDEKLNSQTPMQIALFGEDSSGGETQEESLHNQTTRTIREISSYFQQLKQFGGQSENLFQTIFTTAGLKDSHGQSLLGTGELEEFTTTIDSFRSLYAKILAIRVDANGNPVLTPDDINTLLSGKQLLDDLTNGITRYTDKIEEMVVNKRVRGLAATANRELFTSGLQNQYDLAQAQVAASTAIGIQGKQPGVAVPYELGEISSMLDLQLNQLYQKRQYDLEALKTQYDLGEISKDKYDTESQGLFVTNQKLLTEARETAVLKQNLALINAQKQATLDYEKQADENLKSRLSGVKTALSGLDAIRNGGIRGIFGAAGGNFIGQQSDNLLKALFDTDTGVFKDVGNVLGHAGIADPIYAAHVNGGLFVAQAIIAAHQGTLITAPSVGTGTLITPPAVAQYSDDGLNHNYDASGKLIPIGSPLNGVASNASASNSKAIITAIGAIAGNYLGGALGQLTSPDHIVAGANATAGASAGTLIGGIAGNAIPGLQGPIGTALGSFIGGALGGLIGGLFDKQTQTVNALQIIAANTKSQVTLLENTNKLLNPNSVSFNLPSSFSLPGFVPTSIGGGSGAYFSSSTTHGSSMVANNVQVQVTTTGGNSTDIGRQVAQAVATELSNQYKRSGKYVPRV